MKQFLLAGACLCLISGATGFAQKDMLEKVNQLEQQGHFKEAAAALNQALADKALPAADRKHLEFELDRLARIKKDFSFTKDELFAELQKSVKGLSAQEHEQWLSEGRFDSREIDGQRCFMDSSVANLFFRYPELYARHLPAKAIAWLNNPALEKGHWESCVAIKRAALAEKKPYVLPKRFRVTMTVTADADAAPAGELVRAWLPVPRRYPFQGDFELFSASSPVKQLAEEESPIRCIYLEQPARKDKATEFRIEYNYTMHGIWFNIKPESVRPCDPNDSALKPFTQQAPHVVFTPEIRALAQQIAGSETNPCLKARKFYDWIADHIKYSYAIEYSTIRNISDYCRTKGYGDCGEEALLFITLCRLEGIPARWQSGWNLFPGAKTIHDWSEIYLEPYGWVPVDPYMGVFAARYATTLTPEQRRAIRDFYFGGLDQYRLAANSDHSQSLTPPKRSLRSDDVDFQRGELEWGSHNIYFDRYSYALTLKELKPERERQD